VGEVLVLLADSAPFHISFNLLSCAWPPISVQDLLNCFISAQVACQAIVVGIEYPPLEGVTWGYYGVAIFSDPQSGS
jgi:hypothetical protein